MRFDNTINTDQKTGLPKRVTVRLRNVKKVFARSGRTFAAVDNLSLDLYDG